MRNDIASATLTAELLHDTTTGPYVENLDQQMEDYAVRLAEQLQRLKRTMDACIADLKGRREQARADQEHAA